MMKPLPHVDGSMIVPAHLAPEPVRVDDGMTDYKVTFLHGNIPFATMKIGARHDEAVYEFVGEFFPDVNFTFEEV